MPPSKPRLNPEHLLQLLALICAEPGIRFDDLKPRFDVATSRTNGWGISTVRRYLTELRQRGLLEARNHGAYFPKGAFFTVSEARELLDAMRLRGEGLAQPQAREQLDALRAALEHPELADLFANDDLEDVGHRTVFGEGGLGIRSLFTRLRSAIHRHEGILLSLARDPYRPLGGGGPVAVFPLQLIFHDLAWYLLAEEAGTGHFMTFRLDRLAPELPSLSAPLRDAELHRTRLLEARALLSRGWGMAIPQPSLRDGTLQEEMITVAFSRLAAPFLREHPTRHPSQRLEERSDGSLLYHVRLPIHEAVRRQFRRWVHSWGPDAWVVAPAREVAEMARRARAIAALYDT